ncbi:hypothetical protein Vretifemale_16593 [Volvox reticuliferus]|nr:hypothetical protein Vretifemale_16593 [Volvox reticuliferus]
MAAVSFDNTMKGRTGMWLAVLILTRVIRLKVMSALGLLPKYDNVMQSMGPDQGLKQLAQMVAEGRVKVHVDRVMSLEQLPDAHEYVEQGRTRGKVVIKVDSP